MASAVLASGNESSWAQSGGAFMGKLPFLNPNPNPSKKQKQFHHQSANGRNHRDYSPAVTQTASDDAYSFNQKAPVEINRSMNHGGYTSYSISSYTKAELSELRKRFASELEQIQNLRDRIESGQFSGGVLNKPRYHSKSKKSSGGVKRPLPAGSGSHREVKKFSDGLERGNLGNVVGDITVDNERLLKECKQILSKIMKPKNCRIFNTPVDAKLLGLHDYHQIVKRPMDLGTVKTNLAKGRYLTPTEFAADVRLTFNNALLYNPKTDPVNGLAEFFLDKFEELYRPIQQQIGGGSRREFSLGGGVAVGGSSGGYGGGQAEELQGSSWNHIPTPERPKKVKSSPVVKRERMQAHSTASTPSHPPPPQHPVAPPKVQSPAPSPSPVRSALVKLQEVVRPSVPKLPKPRAKDPVKREMSLEEKQKLGAGLQILPQEKMHQLLLIIKKRNEHLAQDGDEIELDIEALDTETLWELDRFVTNWKKMVSKAKRQASLIGNPTTPNAAPSISNADMDEGATSDRNDVKNDDDMMMDDDMPQRSSPKNSPQRVAKKDAGDEDDVDIDDDDMPVTSFPPVEIEKDEGLAPEQGNGTGGGASSSSSSSSSSGSDSSSSSDSDSGSSSSDSDADDAQS